MTAHKEIPKLITVDLEAKTIFIDGTPFPYYIQEGWSVTSDAVMAYLNVSILADAVEVKAIDADRVRDLR